MANTAKTDSPVHKVCKTSLAAIFFIIGGAMDSVGISKASAQEIDLITYCYHFHNWGLSGTTGVDSPLCDDLDLEDDTLIYQDEFCFHLHRFASNWISILTGDTSVESWCNDFDERANPVTWDIFDFHYHNNAGTGTTGPVQ